MMRLTMIAIIAWLGLGLMVKHMRYSAPFSLEVIAAEDVLTHYLSARGWDVSDRLAIGKDQRYGTLIVRKSTCADAAAVMLIDTGDSISEVFERVVKGDVAYVENGLLYRQPPTARLLLRTMLRSIFNALGSDAGPAFPIVAVSPAAAANQGACGMGIAADWAALAEATRSAPRS